MLHDITLLCDLMVVEDKWGLAGLFDHFIFYFEHFTRSILPVTSENLRAAHPSLLKRIKEKYEMIKEK